MMVWGTALPECEMVFLVNVYVKMNNLFLCFCFLSSWDTEHFVCVMKTAIVVPFCLVLSSFQP